MISINNAVIFVFYINISSLIYELSIYKLIIIYMSLNMIKKKEKQFASLFIVFTCNEFIINSFDSWFEITVSYTYDDI